MEPQNSQPPHPGLSPDDAAANLSLATHLSTQLAAPQMSQGPQNATVQAPDVQSEVDDLKKQVEKLQKQVDKDPKDDIKDMKAMIEAALAEEDTKDGKQG